MKARASLLLSAGVFFRLVVACVGDEPEPVSSGGADAAPPQEDAAQPDGGGEADAAPDADVTTTPQVAAGEAYACALTATGDVYCWGANGYAQSGESPIQSAPCDSSFCAAPHRVEGLPKIQRLGRFGRESSCAIDFQGGVWCWGNNDRRQLGFDSTEMCTESGITRLCQTKPKRVDGIPPMVQVASGGQVDWHTCAVTAAGTVYCWGDDSVGQAAQSPPTKTPLAPAAALPPLTNAVVDVALPFDRMGSAVRANKVYTWGGAYLGSLGRTIPTGPVCPGGVYCDPTPGAVQIGPDGGTDLNGIAEARMGASFGVARATDGSLHVWGLGNFGLLHDGSGEANHFLAFAAPAAGAPKADAVDVRTSVACLRAGGDVHCWGANTRGQVGTGKIETLDCTNAPVACVGKAKKVNGLPAPVVQVSTGAFFVVALLESGAIVGWGDNTRGQMGRTADADPALTPEAISGLPVFVASK